MLRPYNFDHFFLRRIGNIAFLLNSRRLRCLTTPSSLGEDLFVGPVVFLQPLFLVVRVVKDEVWVSIDGVQIRRQCQSRHLLKQDKVVSAFKRVGSLSALHAPLN